MAKQRYVNTKFWRDSYIEDLDPTEKLLFLYLLTNPDTNICGIYEIPLKIIAVDTGIEKSMVVKLFERFEKDNKIMFRDGWVAFKNFTSHQTVNQKIKTGIETEIKKAPIDMVKWVNLNEKISYTYPICDISDLNSNRIESNTNEIELPDDKSSIPQKTDFTIFEDYYFKKFESATGFKPEYKYPVSRKLLKPLIDKYGNEKMKSVLDNWFNDSFGAKTGYGISQMVSQINALLFPPKESNKSNRQQQINNDADLILGNYNAV